MRLSVGRGIIVCLLLNGCRLGNTQAPTPIPQGVVYGQVISGGAVAGATVSLYDGSILLATTRTTTNGGFTLAVQSPNAALHLVATGGSYTEIATGLQAQSSQLTADITYMQGQSRAIDITPLTTITDQLSDYLSTSGASSSAAHEIAMTEMKDWLGFTPNHVTASLLNVINNPVTWGPSIQYGLILAGLSQWAHDNTANPSTAFLTTVMVSDVRADGLLNGVDAQGPLEFAGIPLSATVYRQSIAHGFLQIADTPNASLNDATVTLQGPLGKSLVNYAEAIETNASPLLPAVAPSANPAPPLEIGWQPLPMWSHGILTVTGSVLDADGLPVTVSVDVDGVTESHVTTFNTFTFGIATNAFADGMHTVTVQAQDDAGNSASVSANIGFDNSGPSACLEGYYGSPLSGLAAGHWSDISGIASASFNGGLMHALPDGVWTAPTNITALDPMVVVLTDQAGNQKTFVWSLTQTQNTGQCQ